MVTAEQLAAFHEDGVLVIPDFYSAQECSDLRSRMDAILEEIGGKESGSSFSTTEQSHANDRWFLESGDKVRVFLEDEAARAPEAGPGHVLTRRANKVGHALHDLDPTFAAFSRAPQLAALATALGFVDPLLLQSMYIFKPPAIGGEVVWHCDHTFLWTEPQTVVGFWVAIDEATEENGCMWYLPGSHRIPADTRFRREGQGTVTEVLADPPHIDPEAIVPIPADPGTLVVLHGTVRHWSAPNHSSSPRHAYTLHVIDGTAEYPADNWLQRPELPLRGF